MSRQFALLGMLLFSGVVLSACEGTLFVTNTTQHPCANVSCPAGYTCDQSTGTCTTPEYCSSQHLNGSCPPGTTQSCIDGVCNDQGSGGQACQAGVNGYCANGGQNTACVSGQCVTFDSNQACGPNNFGGLCPGGEVCLDGYCFLVSDNLVCSSDNTRGACPIGQTCTAGACVPFVCSGTGCCSPTNWNGACGTGQTCAQGTCVGPFVGCSASNPTGACPASETCISGTCYTIDQNTSCSMTNTTGLCAGNATCVGGYCQAINPNNACSTKFPSGYCPGGATCDHAACVQTACGHGGYDCSASATPGSLCINGTCVAQFAPCDAVHPTGICGTGEACINGVCGQPTCTYDNPTGACEAGLVCYTQNPSCTPSDSSLCCNTGPCAPGALSSALCPDPINQTCSDGQCLLNACSSSSPEGFCNASLTTYDPTGKAYSVNAECCDQSMHAQFPCNVGDCYYPPCSTANPHGVCPQLNGVDQVCDPAGSGTCVPALCTPYYQNGYCTDSSLSCVSGTCAKVNCVGQSPDPDTYCAPLVCDTLTSKCKLAPCSTAHQDGYCTAGQTCCNQNQINAGQTACTTSGKGTCFAPNCSAQFPGGVCSTGNVCASGACTPLPCGATYTDPSNTNNVIVSTNGTCGKNYKCTTDNSHNPNIYCALQNCSATAPGGFCADVDTYGDRCVSGSCVAYKCSNTFPNGPCTTSGQICGTGNVCVTPACSTTYPGGSCPTGYACSSGSCVQLPCSGANPTGACPANQTCCNAGNQNSSLVACLASNHNQCVHNNCSSANPNGACNTGFACVSGTCTSTNCGAAFPNGPCSGGNICVSGTCQQPNCSTTYPAGACANGNICANGTCVKPGCSPSNTTGACPSGQQCCATGQACDTQNHNNVGHCVQLACSTSAPEGFCSTGGQVCCDSNYVGNSGLQGCTTPNIGTCQAATCSPTFPAGKCANGNQVCINSNCVFPCSSTNPTGFCPSGFACVGAAAGQGGCATTCDSGLDYDCDFILNTDEGLSARTDTDGDGIPDAYDTDSDNDSIPDSVEAGDHVYTTAPISSNSAGVPNFRSTDSDGDNLLDTFEAGPAPAVPRDTDGDGFPDYIDPDSDNDGILDRCEARDPAGATRLCQNTNKLSSTCKTANCLGAIDTDGDGTPDFRQKDSDGDGVTDTIEARVNPWDGSTLNPNGVDHDSDGAPDYRDLDSDNDSVLDADEDSNGNGIVDCQLDGNGNNVVDNRPTPACGSTSAPFSASQPYNYNPYCQSSGNQTKCVLSETNRVFSDTDGNGIGDGSDGIFEVCSTANLKPVNIFFSQAADYAFALEQQYTNIRQLTLNNNQVGLSFDDPVSTNGSGAVSGFIIARTPDPTAIAASPNTLVQKALQQSNVDATTMSKAVHVTTTSFGLTINRNFTSFDGYGGVVDQYAFNSNSTLSSAQMRDNILLALTNNALTLTPAASSINAASPTAAAWVLQMETLYRYDGRVIVMGAVTPAGTNPNSTASYSYRTLCSAQTAQTGCQARPGCSWTGSSCIESSTYQIPLFYSDNIANGSAITQWGDSTANLCESLVQNNSIVDFLWTVDTSGSMAPKIGQVSNSAALFFPILQNSEADYRVSYTTTTQNSPYWPPVFPGCTGITSQAPCEAWSTQGGCSWTGSACVPMCTAWNGAGNSATCASHGCVFNSATNLCAWGGCSALNANTNAAWVKSMCTYYDCTYNTTTSQCQFSGLADRTGGALAMDFTGAIGGVTNLSSSDRSVSYACSEGCASPTNVCTNLTTSTACGYNSSCSWSSTKGCTNSEGGYCGLNTSATSCATNSYLGCAWNGTACVSNCCPTCLSNTGATPNDPACYFAARLPNDEGSGYEFGLLMTEWALYRAGAQPGCGAFGSNSAACNAAPGCVYTSGQCIQAYCYTGIQNPNGAHVNSAQSECNGDPNTFLTPLQGAGGTPTTFSAAAMANFNYGGLNNSPANCEWDPTLNFCVPSTGLRCSLNTSQATCVAASNGRCFWNTVPSTPVCEPSPTLSGTMCSATTQSACVAQGFGTCQWDTCSYSTAAACNAVYGCGWNNGTCSPLTSGGTCRPPLKRMLRNNATKVAVLVSDEEECYEKDGANAATKAFDGDCTGGQFSGGLMSYTDQTRVARVNSFSAYMQSLGVLTFALTGDQANKALAPETTSRTNGGCTGTYYNAEAGQAYIDVAQSTGGGWGSLCASNLFPSTEAVVINALAKASPYKLLGFVNIGGVNETVQPISSTIEVATQSCVNPSEYPNCGSGTHVSVVPRSRDNGYDYDAVNNTLILYGAARPVTLGSITVSYKYWVNQSEPNTGNISCPCPSTTAPGCACPAGEVCGITGSGTGTTNTCAGVTTPLQCAATPGCLWNTAQNPTNSSQVGFCEADGLCAPDPTCGGTCATGKSCDPGQGLCVCDPSCESVGGCNAGSKCDNNSACTGKTQSACTGSCQWDTNLQACYSATCGTCLCDTTCSGGCAAGQKCNTNTSSSTCGQCTCDTTCGGGCPTGETCNSDPNSPTCGFCQPQGCTSNGQCATGQVCASGFCVCDTTCGGSSGNSCGAGQKCNSDTSSATCGQCGCDPTCGGACPAGQTCNSNTTSATCGLCLVDSTCGGGCNQGVCRASTQSACNALGSTCRWSVKNSACEPAACKACNSTNGLCGPDPACCGGCDPGYTCNSATGQCVCDTTCGGSCPLGQMCDQNTTDATCGQCVCDPNCGVGCLSGQICNHSGANCGLCTPDPLCGTSTGNCNPTCSANSNTTSCAKNSSCRWEAWANNGQGLCAPVQCRTCVSAQGFCEADPTCCGGCGPTEVCNTASGQCSCDTSCGGGCSQAGFVCNSNTTSPTCGSCVCDTTCGGAACPAGEVCDTGASSATCGQCVISANCGGQCAAPLVCNSSTGLCGPNPACGGCPTGFTCNYITGQCETKGG